MLRSRFASMIATTIILGLCMASTAQATVILQIERVSDTQGILHATGTVEPGTPGDNLHLLAFASPFTVDPSSTVDIFNGPPTITIGSNDVDIAYQSAASQGLFGGAAGFYFGMSGLGIDISLNDALSGMLVLDLVGGATWGAIGSSGSVQWGIFFPVAVGTWEIVSSSVPAPTTLVLMGLGLASFGYKRRRSMKSS